MTNQLSFHTTTIKPFNNKNQIWITSSDLAKLLEYKSSDSVTKIYNRNSDEFTSKMTQTVNLTASGNYQKTVRIFSLRGSHLIAMLAKTKVAKEVRKWLLDLADKEVGIIDTISVEQQQAIRQAVSQRAYRTDEHHQAVYHKLYEYFKIPRYQDLPASRFDDAIKFLGGILFTQNVNITESNLNCLINHSLWIYNFWQENRLYRAFTLLGSNFGTEMHNHIGSCYTLSLGLKRELDNSKQLITSK